MALKPDIPDFRAEPSLQRLLRIEARPVSEEIDLVIAQDVLNSRISAGNVQSTVPEAYFDSSNGSSRVSWIYRLGGADALKHSIVTLPEFNSSRAEAVIFLSNLAPDRDFFLSLAKGDKNIEVIKELLASAISTDDFEIVDIIEERMVELKPENEQSVEAVHYGWLGVDIKNYQMERKLREGKTAINEEPEEVLPYKQDPKYNSLVQKSRTWEITDKEFKEQLGALGEERATQLRNVVAYAVSKGDPNILHAYLQKSGYSGDLMQDQLQYTLAEVGIIEKGISILEEKNTPRRRIKPVFEIIDAREAEAEFDKEAAKYHEFERETEDGMIMKYRGVACLWDRAYWLVIRLCQLNDIPKLKQILNDEYASIGVRKEAARQLLLKGETKFLEGYSLSVNQPVGFWDNKVRVDKTATNPNVYADLERDSAVRERISEDLPSYVSAIFEAKIV